MLPLLRNSVHGHLSCHVTLAAGDYKPGDMLGKYRVLEVIGRGSNGVTYKVGLAMLCHKQHILSRCHQGKTALDIQDTPFVFCNLCTLPNHDFHGRMLMMLLQGGLTLCCQSMLAARRDCARQRTRPGPGRGGGEGPATLHNPNLPCSLHDGSAPGGGRGRGGKVALKALLPYITLTCHAHCTTGAPGGGRGRGMVAVKVLLPYITLSCRPCSLHDGSAPGGGRGRGRGGREGAVAAAHGGLEGAGAV